jgi:hypothetical protein
MDDDCVTPPQRSLGIEIREMLNILLYNCRKGAVFRAGLAHYHQAVLERYIRFDLPVASGAEG